MLSHLRILKIFQILIQAQTRQLRLSLNHQNKNSIPKDKEGLLIERINLKEQKLLHSYQVLEDPLEILVHKEQKSAFQDFRGRALAQLTGISLQRKIWRKILQLLWKDEGIKKAAMRTISANQLLLFITKLYQVYKTIDTIQYLPFSYCQKFQAYMRTSLQTIYRCLTCFCFWLHFGWQS